MHAFKPWIRQLSMAFVWLCLGWLSCQELSADEPRSAAQWLGWFSENWNEDNWGLGKGRAYMRPLDDKGWQARMLAMQGIAANRSDAVPALLKALAEGDEPTRILSAQVLGYLAPAVPHGNLTVALNNDANAAVRLYAVDSLGMQGGLDLTATLAPLQQQETNGDVRKHIAYALQRKMAPIDPKIVRSLVKWDSAQIDSAKIGKPAPDFELTTVSGKSYRLSDFRGKQSVVLVFIYGDT